ncbi:MAG: YidC/Oxa1 family membrane protein insertase [Candidatus Pacebacteria bacterium]|jgi:YidC/Oxa1 family membrane protein insertase|nr:YidC/Oxa1 family membrane protein insertase [Candidatus Paceibacterota bacterium]
MFIFTELIYRPLFNLLVFLYDIVPGNDIGVAVIVLTILVRLALYKVNGRAIKGQRELQEIQPEIKEIQKKYKDNKEKQAQELMAVYQKRKISPFSGCLPLLIQFPIIIALYQVFMNGFRGESLDLLYSFVPNPGHLNTISFGGIIDLANPNLILAVLAASLQYFQTKSIMSVANKKKEDVEPKKKSEMTPEEKMQDFTQSLSKNMMYMMPAMTLVFGMTFPSGLALYWSVTTLFAIVQQYLIIKKRKGEEAKS